MGGGLCKLREELQSYAEVIMLLQKFLHFGAYVTLRHQNNIAREISRACHASCCAFFLAAALLHELKEALEVDCFHPFSRWVGLFRHVFV